jgi:hypothetical protein
MTARHIELITEICTTMKGANMSSSIIDKGLEMLWEVAMKSDN